MKQIDIDINCDVGEGIGNETQILPFISSCNIACGGHAGNTQSMQEVVRIAKLYTIKLGAHPSYPDPINFGRVSMQIEDDILLQSIQEQIARLISVLDAEGVPLHHIKPHGALYNNVAKDVALASIFLKAIAPYKRNAYIYTPYNSVIEKIALNQGYLVKREAFADRSYNSDLSLVSRRLPKALIEKPKEVLEHLVKIARDQEVVTVTGESISILADTYCVHGDTPSALEILMYLSKELPKHQIQIKK